MGKHDFLAPKAIANRVKAKGLQKLRWFCQMCQKQCRDENGFKCHLTSDAHMRQMAIFGENPQRVIDGFSEQFEEAFLEHMRTAHRFKRVAAAHAYNELITDRLHIHMNATKWLTLTEFITYLGREGKLKVEQEDDRGTLFITYIDRDPDALRREEQRGKRMRAETGEEERRMKRFMEQRQNAEETTTTGKASHAANVHGGGGDLLERSGNGADVKLAFSLGTKPVAMGSIGAAIGGASARALPVFGGGSKKGTDARMLSSTTASTTSADGQHAQCPPPPSGAPPSLRASHVLAANVNGVAPAKEKSALASIVEEQERERERMNRKDHWLRESIVVKIIDKKLREQDLYKRKGVVVKVIDTYVAEVEVTDGDDIIVVRVDQAKLETVIPKIGGAVIVVNGAYRGYPGKLVELQEKDFKGVVMLSSGPHKGRKIVLEYEDFSRSSAS